MKKIILLLLFVPALLFAQNEAAEASAFLDKAVKAINADSPLQMDYSYKVFDDEGNSVQEDNGVIRLDGKRYALLMDNMKVWCNGKTQWSYMKEIDEIYITAAESEEAQSLSPLAVMEMYRKGYASSLSRNGDMALVRMTAEDEEADIDVVELEIDARNNRLVAMFVNMRSQGRVEVRLTNYAPKCSFAAGQYECPVGEYPAVEIVDMR